MSELTYRPLTVEDAEIYRTLRLRGLKEEIISFGDSYDEAAARPLTHFREGLAKNQQFGAFLAGALAGHVGVERFGGAKTRHKAWIWGVYVVPEARGRGVSKQLLANAIAWAGAQAGLEKLLLSTDATNRQTVSLYRSFGFEEFGIEKHIFKLPDGRYVDDLLMVRFLR